MLDPSYSPHQDDPFPGTPRASMTSAAPSAGKAAMRAGLRRLRAAPMHLLRLATPATRADRILLAVLLAMDLALIAGYLAFAYAEHYGLTDNVFHGDLRFSFVEGGYPEMWGYGKQALIALLLLGTHAASRESVHRALALLFVVTLLDDSLALHEILGARLSAAVGLSGGIGDLVAWAAIGLVPLLMVLKAYRSAGERARADAEAVIAGFAVLLFFAVGMDLAHGVVQRFVSGFQTVLTVTEDGGELLTLTLICTVAHRMFRCRRPPLAGAPARAG